MHLLRTVDLKGNAILGPAVYITVVTAHSLGGGLDVAPGKVMLVDKSTANARIHAGMARLATPEEIALFEAERERDAAALADARTEDDEVSRIAAERALEEEIERRVAEKVAAVKKGLAEQLANAKQEIVVKFDDEAAKKMVIDALEALGIELEGDDTNPAGELGAITHGDPQPTNRDPKPRGQGRGGRN